MSLSFGSRSSDICSRGQVVKWSRGPSSLSHVFNPYQCSGHQVITANRPLAVMVPRYGMIIMIIIINELNINGYIMYA